MKTFHEWLVNEIEIPDEDRQPFDWLEDIAKTTVRLIQQYGIQPEEALTKAIEKYNITDDFDIELLRNRVASQLR